MDFRFTPEQEQFREEIRGELTMVRLREREVEGKILVSDGEVDLYLANQASTGANEEYQLAHILLRAPESASPEQLQKLKLRGEQALKRAKAGENFAELTASTSSSCWRNAAAAARFRCSRRTRGTS